MSVRSLVLPYQARMTDTLHTNDDGNSELCSLETPADIPGKWKSNLHAFMPGVLARCILILPRPLQTFTQKRILLTQMHVRAHPGPKAGKRSLTSDRIVIFASSCPFLRIELIRSSSKKVSCCTQFEDHDNTYPPIMSLVLVIFQYMAQCKFSSPSTIIQKE